MKPLRIRNSKVGELAHRTQSQRTLAAGEITLHDAYWTYLILNLRKLLKREVLYKHPVIITQTFLFCKCFLKKYRQNIYFGNREKGDFLRFGSLPPFLSVQFSSFCFSSSLMASGMVRNGVLVSGTGGGSFFFFPAFG